MKPSHVHAAVVLTALGSLAAMMAGLIPEVAGAALLGVSKVAAAISGLTLAGHAHLTRAAHNPRDRLLFATLTLLALLILAWSIIAAWSSFTWPLWAFIGLLLALAVASLKPAGVSA